MNINTGRGHFFLLNIGHFLDHFFMLVFPAAVLFLSSEWALSYNDLLKLGSAGALAYGAGALPAGWLGDKFGRTRMMTVFFIGIGLASVMTGLANSPMSLAIGVGFIGLFAAIYHPVGIALVYGSEGKKGRLLAINGVWGNLGLAAAAMTTTWLATHYGWRMAFIVPGLLACGVGSVYGFYFHRRLPREKSTAKTNDQPQPTAKQMWIIFFAIVAISSAGGLVFNSTTTALPKIFSTAPRFAAWSLSGIGTLVTVICAAASLSQLVIGELMEKIAPQKLLASVIVIQILTFFLLLQTQWTAVCLGIILIAAFGQVPINDWLTGRFAYPQWRSLFFAARYTMGLGMSYVGYWLIVWLYSPANGFGQLYQTLVYVLLFALVWAVTMWVVTRKYI